jgi:ADP-ribosylglycohydrolase
LLARAQGCLVGQLSGDALGSLVEFQSPEKIRRSYPQGVRELADGGTWNTIAGQPTDDSEMALLLARMLVKQKAYDSSAALKKYQFWLDSNPFDCGMTISSALRGHKNHNNGNFGSNLYS